MNMTVLEKGLLASDQAFRFLDGKSVLVTGGTGSFGRKFIELALQLCQPQRLIVFSRDELKQSVMSRRLAAVNRDRLRFFIGDVRDRERLYRALDGVEIVVHAAALKQVPTAEYNPIEAIRTNVMGAENIIEAAIDRNVEKVLALSTDKAVNPVNLYGATKLCSDKLFISANNYSGSHQTRFSLVRYGNVMGSRGSVIPLFLQQQKSGTLTITDPRMTRFWLTLEQAARFVATCLPEMSGGEIFVPKVPGSSIMTLAAAIAPGCTIEHTGIRPGEKLHETLITEDDARFTWEHEDRFIILSPTLGHLYPLQSSPETRRNGRPCPDGFTFVSHKAFEQLDVDSMRRLLQSCELVADD